MQNRIAKLSQDSECEIILHYEYFHQYIKANNIKFIPTSTSDTSLTERVKEGEEGCIADSG
jgi:hypothetical protein